MYSLYGEFVKLMKGTPGRRKASLPFRFIAPLLRQEARKKERVLAQGCGIIIRRQGKSLFYERDIVSNGKIGYFIEVKLGVPFALADHQYILDMVSEENTKTDDYICAFNAQKVVPPLIIRSRKEGDKIDLGFGRKRLKKLFNDWKVGTDEKERIPIVTDGMGVLAVLGFMAGYPNVVRRGAEVKDVENADKALIFCRIAE
jgi:tRNA(Ile)-lysidine synthetase-like protein